MYEIKYHPLVDADTEGSVKVPMFCTTDGNTVERIHALYLRECIPHYFRLMTSKPENHRASVRMQ